MTIIDRYLLRQFLRAFVICFCSLAGLYIVFDAFTHLEEFLDCAKGYHLLALMGSHYSYRSLAFFNRTSGLLALVAAMFTMSLFQRHNEMTALLSAGISRIRIVLPIILAAVVISLLSAANRELVIPRFRQQLARKPGDLAGDVPRPLETQLDYKTGILFDGKATYAREQRIKEPSFFLPRGLDDYGHQLVAENGYYKPAEGNRPSGYLLAAVKQPDGVAGRPSLRLGNQPVVITPRDAPDWLQPDQCFVVSELDFEQLTGGQAFRQFSSTSELIAGLRDPSQEFGADIRVAIHTRILNPMLDITLLFLGLPLVVSRESRNVFVAIGLCIAVVTVFLLVVIGFQQLGSIYLIDAAPAAWMPLILFVPPAVWFAQSMWQ